MHLNDADRCNYIRITGHPCKSPALKGKNFCYFHQQALRGVDAPYAPTIDLEFILENEESIQYAIMETLNAIARGRMDRRTGSVILQGLNIAVRNAKNRLIRFNKRPQDMVREIPNYARQYLKEHPEYGEPLTDAEIAALRSAPADSLATAPPPSTQTAPLEPATSKPSAPQPVTPESQPVAPTSHESTSTPPIQTLPASANIPLNSRQTNQWKQLRSSIEGARRGNLKDLKTCFEAIGLMPPARKKR